LILSFDDGLRSHVDVVAPLLEAYGFVGWFMIPPAFIEAHPDTQRSFAEEHHIDHFGFEYGDSRLAMTWNDIRALDARHVVGCHSWDHTRLSDRLDSEGLKLQTSFAKHRIEEEIGHETSVFAWVGGEDWTYSRGAAKAIELAGFTYSFTSHSHAIRPSTRRLQLPRTNMEASWPDEVMRFQLSGLMDLYHDATRRRVNRRIEG
jgi:peptidoglycan/xylan/chitin deacetylase (PgdA/CDA1 family)